MPKPVLIPLRPVPPTITLALGIVTLITHLTCKNSVYAFKRGKKKKTLLIEHCHMCFTVVILFVPRLYILYIRGYTKNFRIILLRQDFPPM